MTADDLLVVAWRRDAICCNRTVEAQENTGKGHLLHRVINNQLLGNHSPRASTGRQRPTPSFLHHSTFSEPPQKNVFTCVSKYTQQGNRFSAVDIKISNSSAGRLLQVRDIVIPLKENRGFRPLTVSRDMSSYKPLTGALERFLLLLRVRDKILRGHHKDLGFGLAVAASLADHESEQTQFVGRMF